VQRQPAADARRCRQGCSADTARTTRVLAIRGTHAGSVGTENLLDRRWRDQLEWRRRFGLPCDGGRVHLRDASSSGPHALQRPPGCGDMVARPLESEFRGARERLVETLQDKGIRDLAVLRAFGM